MTRAIAMKAGWMWQIRPPEHTGTGYVFSNHHIDEEQAIKEAQEYFGFKVEPRTLINV